MYSPFQKKYALIALFSALLFSGGVFAAENLPVNKHIFIDGQPLTAKERAIIDSGIKKFSFHGEAESVSLLEAEGYRIYLYGYLKNVPVVAVQFTMEYGNGERQYLMVFNRKTKKLSPPRKIGGAGYRKIAIYDIEEKNVILACAKFYGPNDPLPSPSVDGTTRFAYDFNKMIEENGTLVNDDSHPKTCIPQ